MTPRRTVVTGVGVVAPGRPGSPPAPPPDDCGSEPSGESGRVTLGTCSMLRICLPLPIWFSRSVPPSRFWARSLKSRSTVSFTLP